MNIKFLFSFIIIFIFSTGLKAQNWGGGSRGNWSAEQMNVGRLYGKVIDAATGKKMEFATVRLFQNKWDSVSKSMKSVIIGGQLTEANGDFSIEKLSLFGKFILKIGAIGYKELEMETSFGISFNQGANIMEMAKKIEKDLGNIKLEVDSKVLKEVVVDGSEPDFKLDIDKKVYNVDKNPINAGGTAEDVMKNIPSVTIDIDGNVALRNAAPQIFVDGRPTTLTLDQIPADAIETVELITNPSAKYDASGGMGGIINIVLKKSKRIGYNGMAMGGIDSRGKVNGGLNLNVRESKLNFFVGTNYNQRKSIGYGETERENFIGSPRTNVFQISDNSNTGFFALGRAGFDYFIDNRNTLTLSGSYHEGGFKMNDNQKTTTDSLHNDTITVAYSTRDAQSERKFKNYGASLLYKYIFPKPGRELTADVNYNSSASNGEGLFETRNYNSNNTYRTAYQKQISGGGSKFITAQTDLVNPVSETSKIETGLRAAIRNFENLNENFIYSDFFEQYILLPGLTNNYKFKDAVYAAYATYTGKVKKVGYQAGLRAESSDYRGELPDSSLKFRIAYPLSLFPSLFTSYALNQKNELQLSYTRRVNRPNFFQLMPFTDYSDSLNLRRGNPALKPEFTHSVELNHQFTKDRNNNIITTLYFKNAKGLITNYQVLEFDTTLQRNAVITTYANAEKSYSYGLELTAKNKIKSWFDVTTNLNFYNTVIDGTNLQASLSNELFSWFGKLNLNFKLPKDLFYQVTAEYQAKSIMPAETRRPGNNWGGMFGGVGGGWGMGSQSTAQGYNRPRYEISMSLRYEFLKEKAASITVSVNDPFKIRRHDSYSKSDYFVQNSIRYRDPQLVRLNFSYRFGKFDTSLFRRKNNKINMDTDMMQGM